MTSSAKPTAPVKPQTEEGHPLLGWLERNRKAAGYAVGAVLVIAAGVGLYFVTAQRKAVAAADALDRARAAFEGGNLPGAAAEFQRVTQTYGGTDAALEAQLELNAVRLASGQTQLAVDALKTFAASNPPAFYASGAWSLLGSGLENLKKFDEAAQAYSKAAEIATENYRKIDALLAAARSWRLAGKQQQALDTLRGIVSKYPKETPGVAEAEVRLSELTRGAM
jgi:TolA-binding protein